MPICCCFGGLRRRKRQPQGPHKAAGREFAGDSASKGKQPHSDGLRSPLSCNSFTASEYFDCAEQFSVGEAATSPIGSIHGTPRQSISYEPGHTGTPRSNGAVPGAHHLTLSLSHGADAAVHLEAGAGHGHPHAELPTPTLKPAFAPTPVGGLQNGSLGKDGFEGDGGAGGGVYDDPSGYPLAGTSETSEEPLHAAAAGGPMSRLAGCLSILESIRMPTLPGTGSGTQAAGAAGAAGAATGAAGAGSSATAVGPGPASLSHAASGGAAAGGSVSAAGGSGGGGGRSRRLAGKMEPGSSLRRRDMSMSVMDVREAWDECAECRPLCTSGSDAGGGAEGPASPSSSGRPFMVRGQDYMKTKVKIPARGAIYRLLAADVVSSDTKLTHVAKHVNMGALHRMACGLPPAAAGGAASVTAPQVDPQLPPLLIITIMLPLYPASLFGGNDGPSQSLVYYFALPPGFNPAAFENQTALGLLRRFVTNGRETDGSPTRDRLKLIPRVVNVDEWASKGPLSPAEHKLLATYNDKPILTRPQQYFYSGPGYLEVDIDIHSYQFLARKAFSAYFNRLQSVIFENAFVIQGNCPEELPEQVLGAVRMYRLDMMRPRPLRDFLQPPAAPAGGGAALSPAPPAQRAAPAAPAANLSNAQGQLPSAATGVAEALEEGVMDDDQP